MRGFAKYRDAPFYAAVAAAPEKDLRKASFIVHATRGLIRDQRNRRMVMSALLVFAVLMLIAGTTFLHDTLSPREHAVRFILFWLVCAWFTITALLLALFDAVMVRAQARAERRRLRGEFGEGRSVDVPNESDSR